MTAVGKFRKDGWIKVQTGRYLKDWKFRYGVIEGHFFNIYKKSNCKDQTHSIDLAAYNVQYDIQTEKQFILEYHSDASAQYVFLCTSDKDANKWIKHIYTAQQQQRSQQLSAAKQTSSPSPRDVYGPITLESISDLDTDSRPQTVIVPTVTSMSDIPEQPQTHTANHHNHRHQHLQISNKFNGNEEVSISRSVPSTDEVLQPNADDLKEDEAEHENKNMYKRVRMQPMQSEAHSRLDIMRMLINNHFQVHSRDNHEHHSHAHNHVFIDGNQRLLQALESLVNGCYDDGYIDDINQSIICEWHLVKCNEYDAVVQAYMQHSNERPNLRAVHYVLYNTLIVINAHCMQFDELHVFDLLNQFVKLQRSEQILWRVLMEHALIHKVYQKLCRQILRICQELEKAKLYLFPHTLDGFDHHLIYNQRNVNCMDVMMMEKTTRNGSGGYLGMNGKNSRQAKYHCVLPGIVTQKIDVKMFKRELNELFLSKIYVST